MKTDRVSNQLRWVILLLAAAVILPTVCLLWFMNQAVKNERLAVRQKLIDWYTKRAVDFFNEAPNLYFEDLSEHLNSYQVTETVNFFEVFTTEPKNVFEGMLIYDANSILLYPHFAFQSDGLTRETMQPFPDKTSETIELAYQRSYPDNFETVKPEHAADVMRCRVFLAECLLKAKDDRLWGHLRRVLSNAHYNDEKESGFLIGPAETTVWQLQKLIAIARKAGLADRLASEIESAEKHICAYKNAIDVALLYPSLDRLNDWPDQTVRRISPELNLYGFKLSIENRTVLGISTPDKILKVLAASVQDMQDDTVSIEIYDNFGTPITEIAEKIEKPFLTIKAGKYLPDFTVSVFFKGTSAFENAARRQASIYLWTGILVALLILLAGSFAIRAVSHQIKMNRLKNDFIATVTHELKTPLASMRLLVDTLLEGNYEGQQTATEYLQLVANENKRLTHLIDSFLTFSRMERNKQVFDLASVSPVEISNTAIEAVRTKFDKDEVDFEIDIRKPLPMIRADKDGMVTVLVNLLENAYKYTNSDKQIELKVYQENGNICFAVKDNGIGLSPRAQKKIFNRFYQVDSRLSRRAEGCGLGLSIVKFIVDAHKGKIEVESHQGEGSTFTFRLPVAG